MNRISDSYTFPLRLFRLIFVSTLCITILLLIFIILVPAFHVVVSSAAVTFSPSDTPEPTKYARVVPTLTYTPTATRTATATRTRTRTATTTRTQTGTELPSPKPTNTLTPGPSRTTTMAPKTVQPQSTSTPTPQTETSDVGQSYSTLSALNPVPVVSSELNLSARGYAATQAALDLVYYDGPADAGAPQLSELFSDDRTPTITGVFQVNDWDWSCNCRGALLTDPDVTLVSFITTPGEVLRLPRSSYHIGFDFQALVLYADSDRIVLNYTREGNVIRGYTIYVEGVSVDGILLSLYQQMNKGGRGELPALRAGQAFGRARGKEIKFAIRDAGAFLDPRSRKDWWQGR